MSCFTLSFPARLGTHAAISCWALALGLCWRASGSPADSWPDSPVSPQGRQEIIGDRSLEDAVALTEATIVEAASEAQNAQQLVQQSRQWEKDDLVAKSALAIAQARATLEAAKVSAQTVGVSATLAPSIAALQSKISVSQNVATMVREENALLQQELAKFRNAAGRVAQHENQISMLLLGKQAGEFDGTAAAPLSPPAMLQTGHDGLVADTLPLPTSHRTSTAMVSVCRALAACVVIGVIGYLWARQQRHAKQRSASNEQENPSRYGSTLSRTQLRSRPSAAEPSGSDVPSQLHIYGFPASRSMKASRLLRTSPGAQAGTVDEEEEGTFHP